MEAEAAQVLRLMSTTSQYNQEIILSLEANTSTSDEDVDAEAAEVLRLMSTTRSSKRKLRRVWSDLWFYIWYNLYVLFGYPLFCSVDLRRCWH